MLHNPSILTRLFVCNSTLRHCIIVRTNHSYSHRPPLSPWMAAHTADRIIPASEKLIEITKPWMVMKVFLGDTIASRLPEPYKHFYWSWKTGKKAPVHYLQDEGNFKLDEDGETVIKVKNQEVLVVYPDEVNDGLWGGEGVIKGYYHIGRWKGEMSRYWFPRLQSHILYSEVLDKYMEVTTTKRALRQIDQHYGLDFYLLKTPYADVNSTLGFRLKQEILLALVRGSLYPDDPKTKEEVYNKYKEFIVPEDEAEWIGLTLDEAVKKQEAVERVTLVPQPLKHIFRQQLIQYLQDNPSVLDPPAAAAATEGDGTTPRKSWLKKLNPFS